MRKKDRGTEEAQDFTGMPASTPITAADIQQKEFRVSRFGGYRMREVDEFLDRVTEAITRLSEDNQRLRSASGGMGPGPQPIGAPDLADTSRQADEIVERARAEADAILRDAREKAAGTAGAISTDPGRAAVATFLSKEKDFLQQLASLVQGHAESVKAMAKAGRAAAKSAPTAPTPPEPPTPPVARPEPSRPPAAPDETKASKAREPATDPRPTEPIRLEEPASASVPAGEREEEDPAGERDRTLRDLFWGEE